jgi:hypothetical protein
MIHKQEKTNKRYQGASKMKKFKVEDQETINIRKQIAYDYRNEADIAFWELQSRFIDYNERNPQDQIEFITQQDLKEWKDHLKQLGRYREKK